MPDYKRDPKLPEPEHIRLPDGRHIRIKDLTGQVTNRANHNLRKGRTTKIPTTKNSNSYKYTTKERVWQSQATAAEIADRYGCTVKKAQGIHYSARYIVDRLGLDKPAQD